METAKQILEEARQLYNKGEYQKSIEVINSNHSILIENEDDRDEANKIKGWDSYFLAIKGKESEKTRNLELAKISFEMALYSTNAKRKISIVNGLPLVLWILGKKDQAWKVSNEAIEEFSEISSVWNTRSILCRWAGKPLESIDVCQKAYETAMQKDDFKTAGHGKHNRADALVKLDRTEEAKEEYQEAVMLYEKYEEKTNESAKPHILGAKKKLSAL